jgi:hypothetical protein
VNLVLNLDAIVLIDQLNGQMLRAHGLAPRVGSSRGRQTRRNKERQPEDEAETTHGR